MAITIECYEDWGVATGTPARGTNRTLVTNMNLKCGQDPDAFYYNFDLQRPVSQEYSCTLTRWFSFKISGTWSRIKNVRIHLPSAGEEGNWEVRYGLKTEYVEPSSFTGEFGATQGVLDESLEPMTGHVLIPLLSTTGPEAATTPAKFYDDEDAVWTQYLAMQFIAYPSDYLDVDNFGPASPIRVTLDELEV